MTSLTQEQTGLFSRLQSGKRGGEVKEEPPAGFSDIGGPRALARRTRTPGTPSPAVPTAHVPAPSPPHSSEKEHTTHAYRGTGPSNTCVSKRQPIGRMLKIMFGIFARKGHGGTFRVTDTFYLFFGLMATQHFIVCKLHFNENAVFGHPGR